MRIKIKKNKTICTLSIIVVIAVFLLLALRSDLKVVEYDVNSNKIVDNIKVAFIADLHSCDYGKGQERLLKILYAQEPDIILLGGDIIDDKLPRDKAEKFLAGISGKYPCYYVSGNHEFWSGDIDNIKKVLEDYDIQVLEGENISIKVNGQMVEIFGIDDPEIGKNEFGRQLQLCGENINNTIFSILLSHRPELIENYLEYDFDLILAGHAHGGQWRIPGILNGLLAPNQGFFPKYAGGLYQFQNTSMIVSRGLAKESTHIPRIFNRPELVIINIIDKDN